MKDEWFRWEREAAIHLLFPTLEGSMQPLESFTGHGFPTTILIFKNGIVTWCVKENEFYGLGAKLLAVYKDSKKERQMANEITKRLDLLVKAEQEIGKSKLSKLSNESLADLYSKLHKSFISYYGIGAIQEPLAMQAEIELKNSNKSLSDIQISSLTTPTKKPYIREAENYLWQTKDIEEFIKEYYWIDNNYSRTKVLSKADVRQKLEHIKQSKKINPLSTKNLNLNDETIRLIELLKNFATYQDERKRNILIYLHFLEILLKEIGRRGKITLETMRDTFPSDIRNVLSGKISQEFIKNRKKSCFVVWKEKTKRPLILIGKDTKAWEEKLSPKLNRQTQVVKGNCASKGKVKGKVRVLLNASENNKLKKGEILVTFMTSPDFMSAVKRCSAIVTNLGGVTSHAAIISREFGIPCIVGTKNATEILKTGDLVEVDADKGEVKILT